MKWKLALSIFVIDVLGNYVIDDMYNIVAKTTENWTIALITGLIVLIACNLSKK